MIKRALTGAMLFDGSGLVPGTTVVWEDTTIDWVGADDEAKLDGVDVTPADGATLLPGLIDAHVHLSADAEIDGIDRLPTEPLELVLDRAEANAATLLEAGITTARDQGSRDGLAIDVAAAQRAGKIAGARILAAGRGITAIEGHGWQIGVEVAGADAARKAVAAEIERGADVIKLFPTGGVLGTGAHGFVVTMTLDEATAAVEEAHTQGRLVGAHVHGQEGIDLCLEAGVDTIEHGTDVSAEQAKRMADKGTVLVPTLSAVDSLSGRSELDDDLAGRVAEVAAVIDAGVVRAIEAGVTVLAGTDAGTPFNPIGELHREITRLAGLGLGSVGAVQAATARAAAVFGLDDLGAVEPGKRADLILVDGDPLADLSVLASPRLVVQDGIVRNSVTP